MKLDSIIYDINPLKSAIQSSLIAESPTFNAMYPSETASSLVDTLSGVSSMLQYTLVSAMANCYTDSAYSPSGIYQLAETLGNKLHGNIASRIICDIYRDTTFGTSLIIPKESVFEVNGLKFFNKSAVSFAPNVHRVNDVTLIQGQVVEVELVTSGIAGEKLYFGESFKVDPENIQVFVNGEEWNVSDTFIAYDASSVIDESELKVVVFRTNSDGQSYIKMGNGVSGLLPQANTVIKVRYVENEGSKGNITKSDLDIQLKTNVYDSNNVLLKVSFPKTTTSYGGSDSQSLDVLKESSPYVFASGNRCVRRTDYYSMLLNKCGYISASVWGEYEEAQFYGTYDKIMMNMVYYTGIKEFKLHSYENIGMLTDEKVFNGNIGSSKAFPGSVSVKLTYAEDTTNEIYYEDNGGKGLLFNNSDYQYPTDNFSTSVKEGTATINLVNEADINNGRDVYNMVYDENTLDLYYESANSPTFVNPTQIRLDFDEPVAIAGLKFYIPVGDVTFTRNAIKSFAVFGTNDSNMYSSEGVETLNTAMYTNARNKTNIWTRVINRSTLIVPNVGNWTNWIATNLYNPNEADEENIWKKFKHYLIEVYSVQDESQSTVKIGKLKVLYNEVTDGTTSYPQVSTIDYDQNGEMNLQIPTLNSLNGFYTYSWDVNNLTTTNYHIGDVLSYTHDVGEYLYKFDLDTTSTTSGYSVGDVVKLMYNSEDTGLRYKVTDVNEVTGEVISGEILEGSDQGDVNYPTGTVFDTELDVKSTVALTIVSDVNGAIITTEDNGIFDNPTGLRVKVTTTPIVITFKVTVDKLSDNSTNDYTYTVEIEDNYFNLRKVPINVVDQPLVSLDGEEYGATISVSSDYGISVDALFTGNKIENNEVARIDQTIINDYNHFTTFVEFRQPEVIQAHISVRVKYKSYTSIEDTRQRIRENVNKLFEITPTYLGQDLKLSDLYNAIHDTEGVDYCLIDTPTSNIIAMPYQFVVLSSLNIEDEI